MRSQGQDTDTAAFVNYFRTRLEQERTELLDRTRNRMRDVRAEQAADADTVRDTIDESDADVQADLELSLISLQSERLDRINLALAQLEQGRYGVCIDCGMRIASPRLQALPFAVRCVDCQDATEAETPGDHRLLSSWRHHGAR